MFINVAVGSILNHPLTYATANTSPKIGQIVHVPLRNKIVFGLVLEKVSTPPENITNIQPVKEICEWVFPVQFLNFLKTFATYNFIPIGMVTKSVLPKSNDHLSIDAVNHTFAMEKLNEEQQKVSEDLVKNSEYTPALLQGVTGSGKTEVYLEICKHHIKNNSQVLILFPEIVLTAAFVERIEKRLGVKPFVWHSKISPKQKHYIWQYALSGNACVIIGARSALLLPFQKLGLIIVDEEHDQSYKQDTTMLYHGRDMALLRAKVENIPIILASATPSLEMMYLVQQQKMQHYYLSQRYQNVAMPVIKLLDMSCVEKTSTLPPWLHPELYKRISHTIEHGGQVLLFLNRKGFATVIYCQSCKASLKCKKCDSSLVLHKKNNILRCHLCGFEKTYNNNCTECDNHSPIELGLGIEQVTKTIQNLFSKVKVQEVTSDTMSSIKSRQDILKSITDNTTKIIVATQILTKGYHFPNITLVACLDSDSDIERCDFRAFEHCYQQLTQVAGRCGRGNKAGEVFVQANNPNHPLLAHIANYDFKNFLNSELQSRQQDFLPPFVKQCAIIIQGKNENRLQQCAKRLLKAAPKHTDLEILGPAPAIRYKINNTYRIRFLLSYPAKFSLNTFLQTWFSVLKLENNIRLIIDRDPINFT